MLTKNQKRNQKKHARRRRKDEEMLLKESSERTIVLNGNAKDDRERTTRNIRWYEYGFHQHQDYDKAPCINDWTVGVQVDYGIVGAVMGAKSDYYIISGKVYNHPEHVDGTPIVTAALVWMDNRYARVQSGSLYKLGSPSSEYISLKKLDTIEPVWEPVWFMDVDM